MVTSFPEERVHPSRRSARTLLRAVNQRPPHRSRCSVRLPLLGVHRRRRRRGSQSRSNCCLSRASAKTGSCRGPFHLALRKVPAGVCPMSRIGHPCGNPHQAGLTGRPGACGHFDLRRSRKRFGMRDDRDRCPLACVGSSSGKWLGVGDRGDRGLRRWPRQVKRRARMTMSWVWPDPAPVVTLRGRVSSTSIRHLSSSRAATSAGLTYSSGSKPWALACSLLGVG